MLYRLQRHPFPVKATFRHSLVLTYALPAARLQPLLPPGLRLDEWNGLGFLAIALVATEGLLPASSPFPDIATARRFAGPMPYTFDYERQTPSLVHIRGVRDHWDPQPVAVEVHSAQCLDAYPDARLANAFYVHDIDYRWEKGVVVAR